MSVQFSRDAGCYVYTCLWGCYGFDFESEEEARTAFLAHDCELTT